jgi:hypothetical protein
MKHTTEQRIVALAQQGMRPEEIAKQTGRTLSTVYHYTCKARREGQSVPKARIGRRGVGGDTIVALNAATALSLRPLADERGQSLTQFCNAVLTAVAGDDLALAILDEEGRPDA